MKEAKIIPFPQQQQPQYQWIDWEEAYWARVAQMRERRRISTERRQQHRENLLVTVFYAAIIAIVVIVAVILSSLLSYQPATQTVFEYEKKEYPAISMKVLDEVNVRSEPRLVSGADGNNSFGMISKGEISIPISKVFRTTKILDLANGEFYGFLVDEILESQQGRLFFPDMNSDPDGIVWIHNSYVHIDYGRGAP